MPFSQRSRRADRAADLAAVVHAHGRARRAGDRGRHERHASASTPSSCDARLPRLDGEHPPLVHLAPAVVGPPAPGLVPRRGDLRRRSTAPRGRGLGARPRRARHVVLERAVAVRDARLARARRPSCARSTRPTCSSTARDIIFLWVARMIMMGLEFTGEVPFADVHVHSIIQAPDGRRMSKSLGTGIDPLDLIDGGPAAARCSTAAVGRLPGLRRRRACAGGCWRCPPARTCSFSRGEGRPGPAAGQQAVERVAADPAAASAPTRARRSTRRTVEDRWILSRLERAQGRGRRADRRATTSPTRRSGCTTSSTASCATGTWSSSSRGCARASRRSQRRCCTCSTETLALAHPMIPFVTEEIYVVRPRRRGAAGGARRRRRRRSERGRRAGRGGARAA